MDGPSANIKFYNKFIKNHREECHHQLIDRHGKLWPSYHPWCPAHWGDKV